MRVNPTTLLFEELTHREMLELYEAVRTLVIAGELPEYGHRFFDTWCVAADIQRHQSLLAMATAFPQRALISVVEYLRDKEGAPAEEWTRDASSTGTSDAQQCRGPRERHGTP